VLGRTDSRLRMVAILLAFAVIAAATGLRLGYWQVIAADELTAQVIEAVNSTKVEKTVRADIVDRDGTLLAKTSSFDSVVAYPNIIDPDDREGLVGTLAALLDLNARERSEYMDELSGGAKWVRLERRITLKQSTALVEAIDDELLRGIALEPQGMRSYPRKGGEPDTSLASHLLGFVRADSRGGEGVERYYDDELTVVDPGLLDVATINGSSIDFDGIDPPPLELTIDAKLQKQVERELNTARNANKAKSASAIVMDPRTGAILAAASVPSYDANDYAAVASEDMSKLRNRVFSDQYEPGSVMKIFTVTAALDLELVTPTTMIRDQKVLEFWKHKVRNADHDSKGNLKVKDVIAWSRNVATAKIARKLAPKSTQKAAHRLHDLWEKVGLTGRTGVDISGEATGRSYDPDERLWAPVDLANRAFGQGVAVTLPQLARGVSTLVNGGFLVQPHLNANGELAEVEKQRVLKAKVARQARDILTHVTGSLPWYAEGSLIPGYEIGGKTGTGQIWDSDRGMWKEKRFNHSFAGFVGGRKQEYVIVVRLEEPVPKYVKQGKIPLRIESYELYQMVARATIKQLGMKKSKDPNAGRPIIGTLAAERLDPTRNRAALQQAKKQAKKQAKADQARRSRSDKNTKNTKSAKAGKTEKARRDKDDAPAVAADGGQARSSGGGGA